MDVTHFSPFHPYSFLHVSIDTHSGFIWASTHRSEKVSDCISHLLLCVATMGKPTHLKMDYTPAYMSRAFAQFWNHWNIVLTHGIPHNPNGPGLF